MVVFFEPQTGIIKDQDWESNFYHFRLDGSYCWSLSMRQWLEGHIAKATVGDDGLVYEAGFMERLFELEQQLDRNVLTGARLGLPLPPAKLTA